MMRNARLSVVLLLTFLLACDTGTSPVSPPVTANPDASAMAAGGGGHGDSDVDDIYDADLGDVARMRGGYGTGGVTKASEIIGASGGSVRLGDFEIIVPPGAVTRPTRFEIQLPPPMSNRRYAAATFRPHNQEFRRPVTIRLPHQATTAAGDPRADVMWWHRNDWVRYPTWRTLDGRIETRTDHFSLYATSRRGITMVGG